MRRVLAVLIVLASVLTAGAATGSPAVAGAATGAGLHQDGRWLLDGQGRVRIDHGVNMVYKKAEYAPDATGFGADDARFLRRNGFTTVRLGLIWKAVEPQPGEYDDGYLDRIAHTVGVLHRHGIVTLLDFHQDLYNERFQGEGAPDWAVQDDGLPAQPQLGFPGNYFAMTAMWRAYDHFWANDPGPAGIGLQDRYAAAWAHVAERFGSTPGVQGYDIFNEPFPGSQWETCLNPVGCPAWDATLQEFSQRVIDAIREVDPATTVYYEPNLFFNDGVPTYVRPSGERLGLSFHDYCGTSAIADQYGVECDVLDGRTFDNADAEVTAQGVTPLLTEFGATDDEPTLRGVTDLAMQHMVGWQFWAYCGCDDPTTTGPGLKQALVVDPSKAPRGDNVDHTKLRLLAIPHPFRVAGTPTSYDFDRDKHVFELRYDPTKVEGGRFAAGSRTTVAVPKLQFPGGYSVRAKGARVVSEPGARTLVLALERGSDHVVVRVMPRSVAIAVTGAGAPIS
jgi:endoglycosylceramidase